MKACGSASPAWVFSVISGVRHVVTGPRRPLPLGKGVGNTLIAFAAYTVVFLVWSWLGPGFGQSILSAGGTLAFLPLNVGAIYWLWRASQNTSHTDGERAGLRLFALMYTLAAIGNVGWAIEAVLVDVDPRYGFANSLYIACNVVGIAAAQRFPVAPRGVTELRKFLIDVACVVLSIGALVWTFVVARVSWSTIEPWHFTVDLGYAVTSIVLLAVLAQLIMRQAADERHHDFTLLASAILIKVAVDLVVALEMRGRVSAMNAWASAISPAMYVLIIYSAARSATRVGVDETVARPPSLNPISLLPTVSAFAVFSALIWAARNRRTEPLGVLISVAVLLNVLFVIRQTISLRENARLAAAQAESERRARSEEIAREAQKLEAISRLTGGIAHDFNNLLTTVLANSEFALLDLKEADKGYAEVSDIRAAAVRGADLIRQLLAFSRKSITAPVLLQPAAIVRDLHAMLDRLVGPDHSVAIDLPADLGAVVADRGQIEQILVTLVTNAREAMPNGGTITISGRNVIVRDSESVPLSVTSGAFVTLSVRDTGTGISREVRDRIFEPFFTTKPLGKGTGLGLASTYGIMRQSSGGVTLESEAGEGACFTLYWPRVTVPQELIVPAPPAVSDDAPDAQGEMIVLVEDEPAVREVARRILSMSGYNVLTAADAVQARAIFAQYGSAIALLITDVMMPGEKGPALATALRKSWPALPVILMSGYTDADLTAFRGDGPGDAFVQKPFTHAELLSNVQLLLKAKPVQSSVGMGGPSSKPTTAD